MHFKLFFLLTREESTGESQDYIYRAIIRTEFSLKTDKKEQTLMILNKKKKKKLSYKDFSVHLKIVVTLRNFP